VEKTRNDDVLALKIEGLSPLDGAKVLFLNF